ncbi:MAG: hypothetical protein U1E65_03420 [Myxococcota bacterium]
MKATHRSQLRADATALGQVSPALPARADAGRAGVASSIPEVGLGLAGAAPTQEAKEKARVGRPQRHLAMAKAEALVELIVSDPSKFARNKGVLEGVLARLSDDEVYALASLATSKVQHSAYLRNPPAIPAEFLQVFARASEMRARQQIDVLWPKLDTSAVAKRELRTFLDQLSGGQAWAMRALEVAGRSIADALEVATARDLPPLLLAAREILATGHCVDPNDPLRSRLLSEIKTRMPELPPPTLPIRLGVLPSVEGPEAALKQASSMLVTPYPALIHWREQMIQGPVTGASLIAEAAWGWVERAHNRDHPQILAILGRLAQRADAAGERAQEILARLKGLAGSEEALDAQFAAMIKAFEDQAPDRLQRVQAFVGQETAAVLKEQPEASSIRYLNLNLKWKEDSLEKIRRHFVGVSQMLLAFSELGYPGKYALVNAQRWLAFDDLFRFGDDRGLKEATKAGGAALESMARAVEWSWPSHPIHNPALAKAALIALLDAADAEAKAAGQQPADRAREAVNKHLPG